MNKDMLHRLRVMVIIVIGIFFLLAGRLAYLQVYNYEYYYIRAEKNRYTKLPIPAPRGQIIDSNGEKLVENKPGFGVYLVDLDDKYDDYTLDYLSDVLDMERADIESMIYKNRYTRYLPIPLMSGIDNETMAVLAENRWKLHGVNIEVQPDRRYVHSDIVSHITGYLSRAPATERFITQWEEEGYNYREGDIVGQDGLEKSMEASLRGEDGEQLVETNSIGQAIAYLDRRDPIKGNDLHLTLDMGLQKAAWEAVESRIKMLQQQGNRHTNRGSAVAIDPRSGAILAMVSYPAYDSNDILDNYSDYLHDPLRPLMNYTINGTYPVGSTFKMVTGIAALEKNKITDRTVHYCGGTFTAVGDTKACHSFHGNIGLYRAMAASCNIYFYRAGLATGIDDLAYYSRELGLGKRTGLLDLPGESEGVAASREYKLEAFGEQWYAAETMSAAIGQTYHSFTPLQLAVYSSILANGGKHYRPYIVDRIVDFQGESSWQAEVDLYHRSNVSPEVFSIIQNSMLTVTQPGGTAGYPFMNFPVGVAAKTGSAQVVRLDGRHIPAHSIFVCYAPFDDPQIALAVVIEHGEYGALSATPVAKEILSYFFNVDQEPEQPDDDEAGDDPDDETDDEA